MEFKLGNHPASLPMLFQRMEGFSQWLMANLSTSIVYPLNLMRKWYQLKKMLICKMQRLSIICHLKLLMSLIKKSVHSLQTETMILDFSHFGETTQLGLSSFQPWRPFRNTLYMNSVRLMAWKMIARKNPKWKVRDIKISQL